MPHIKKIKSLLYTISLGVIGNASYELIKISFPNIVKLLISIFIMLSVTSDPFLDFKTGLVFVIDSNVGMQPYIDKLRETIKSAITRMSDSPLRERFRFGLVAYRDSLAQKTAAAYSVHAYAKPDFSQPPEAILTQIAAVEEAHAKSIGLGNNNLIAGLLLAIQDIDWQAAAGRYIVLITASRSRQSGGRNNSTHLGMPELRSLAGQHGIAVFVIHLLTMKAQDDSIRSRYRELSETSHGSLYFEVPGGTLNGFTQMITILTDSIMHSTLETIQLRPKQQDTLPTDIIVP
jgi:serine/threonine-protein kinase PpkA